MPDGELAPRTGAVSYADGRKSVIVYGKSTAAQVAGFTVVTLTGRVTEGLGAGGKARAARSGCCPRSPRRRA
ncbi:MULTISPECIES: hypothetical protein [unclassified Streptomyces]|uniref:hypothetical protein n=1 Tax=unclassified Streptomyces TaxID=2593676 RepID=UPI00131AC688|nr:MULTISPECIES: hypothetical protein [unclassified Streptomyces]